MVKPPTQLDKIQEILESKLEIINENIQELNVTIKSNHDELTAAIAKTDLKAEAAVKAAKSNSKTLETLKTDNEHMKTTIESQNAVVEHLNDKLSALEALTDDQVNRGLRSTLVFRGIEKNGYETWDTTGDILAEEINNILPNFTISWITESIERVHRAKSTTNIIAKFQSWKDSEKIKTAIINYNKTQGNQENQLKVSQMLSKPLQDRHNAALIHRKELMKENKNMNYTVVYPAKLIGKMKNSEGKYELIQEF